MSRMEQPAETDDGEGVAFGETLVEVDGLTKYFSSDSGFLGGLSLEREFPFVRRGGGDVKAVDDVSFEIKKGETLGLVGESGSGKSTLARTILQLLEPTAGSVYFEGDDLASLSGSELRQKRRDIQMIFQDPQSSLDPRMKVGPIVEEPMKAHGILDEEGREERAKELLGRVGLDPQHYNRYPHAFSGGQRQRVNLARALSVNPDFIVCDEPVSALDVSIQAQVLNTMDRLQDEFGLTYLFIAHDLSVIRHISDRVAVMYLGEIMELADKEELFENPQHPYTESLLASIPVPDPRVEGTRGVLEGDVPSPVNPPSGCRFRTRCPKLIAPEGRSLEGSEARSASEVASGGAASEGSEARSASERASEGEDVVYEWTDAEWSNARAFMRAVDRRSFEPMPARDIREAFFGDAEPRGAAGTVVDEAITLVSTDGQQGDGENQDAWDEAATLLTEAFAEESICAREKPAYEVPTEFGDGRHFAACHLHRDERTISGD